MEKRVEAEEEKATQAAGSAFGARGLAIPAMAAVGTSDLLILSLWLGLSSRSALVLLLGEPLLSPLLELALVLVLLSPKPLLPRGKPPWRKKDSTRWRLGAAGRSWTRIRQRPSGDGQELGALSSGRLLAIPCPPPQFLESYLGLAAERSGLELPGLGQLGLVTS